ncbi:UDP-glucose dehydrogenase family protein [Rhodoferax antarcticus]|uniref:UDP-glucose 6-dehydrogenase n=1 Tax=Rhodoferax antarcticus ANT.BR TaxID=1111071 RepID=A0A1Q8YH77_9BURK|nr:UDP-glucose/GDP-mannose dehydrogenase family protein [Rhodoferax antarcticus]APW45121.1 UDP-glucose 6-dehydrogenase [Rhodoferax antarcticus]OLP07346.1 UDP-glucose 6-dehydrogenase family protein [Rhodoferax antarcticus ANT.BR]
MKITVIGTGYVGLVSGTCLAEVGNEVLCLDVDPAKIKILKDGGIPIYEPGLQDMVKRNVAAGRLHFTTDIKRAAHFGSVQFIAVGTPPDEDGSADMQYVTAAARNIGRYMTGYKVVVDKSTVPVGTADAVRAAIAEELQKRGVNTPFSVVSNPEFLKEGAAIDDFMKPDRIVVGCDDEQAALNMRALYAPFQRNHDRLILMDVRSAELTKYAANAMLATRISFMNELANLAEKLGADIESVRRGIGSDPRIGYDFLYAGAGYGGSCFPKDVKALIKTAAVDAGIDLKVLNAVELANDQQKHVLGNKIKARFGSDLSGKHFALWGLAFKANTDDMREATSRQVIKDLLSAGASVTAYDPVAMAEAMLCFPNEPGLSYADTQGEALNNADALVIVTEWKEFRSPDFEIIKAKLKSPVIFDGRNLYDPKLVRGMGFEYLAIGR